MNKWLQRALSLLGLTLFAVCVWFLQHELRHLDLHKVGRQLRHMPLWRILAAIGLTVIGYVVIVGYDVLALRYIRERVPWSKLAPASFISCAFSNAIALPLLGVGGMRLHFYYKEFHMPAIKVGKAVAFIGISTWLGLLALTGAAVLIAPPIGSDRTSLTLVRIGGLVLLTAVVAYMVVCVRLKTVRIRRWRLRLPRLREALGQLLVGSLDWILQGAVFYALLATAQPVALSWFVPAYLVAMLLAMTGHTPAGLGVFDAGVVLLMSPHVHEAELVSALVLYRLVYHLGPLMLATALFGVRALLQREKVLSLES